MARIAFQTGKPSTFFGVATAPVEGLTVAEEILHPVEAGFQRLEQVVRWRETSLDRDSRPYAGWALILLVVTFA